MVLYGEGLFFKIGEQVVLFGIKVLFISDDVMVKVGNVEICCCYLVEIGMDCVVYIGVNLELIDIYLDEVFVICKMEQCDVVIVLGGGSCIDIGKVVVIMMINEGYL